MSILTGSLENEQTAQKTNTQLRKRTDRSGNEHTAQKTIRQIRKRTDRSENEQTDQKKNRQADYTSLGVYCTV